MTAAAEVLRYVQLAVFVAAAGLAALRWFRRRGASRAWLAATFGLLAGVIAAAQVVPPDGWGGHALVAALLLFPYFLYRFMATFERPPRALGAVCGGLTAAALVATAFVPRFPEPGEPRSAAYTAYVVLVLVQWTFLSAVVAIRLWYAGRGQPTVARRRMRVLASGAAALALALVMSGTLSAREATAAGLAIRGVSIVSAVLFLLGFAPPPAFLRTWRSRDVEALHSALVGLAGATTTDEVVRDVLPRVAELVGADGAAVYDADGRLLGSTGTAPADQPDADGAELVPGVRQVGPDHLTIAVPGGRLDVRTTAYAPYFGRDELDLLRTVATLVHATLARIAAHTREVAALAALAEAQRIAKVGSWRLDLATGTIDASDEMYRLYGLAPQSEPLTRDYYRARTHPDDRAAATAAAERAAETGEDFTSEFRVVDEGTTRWFHARGSALRDGDGRVVALLGTCQDVTEQRRLERVRRDFVANAAHELRTPLTTVAGMATLLATHRARLSDAEMDRAFAALGRQGERAQRLVTSLLDLSRLEAGRVPVQLGATELRGVVDRALEAAPPPDGVTVTTPIDGVTAVADPARLEEIVVNLLTNAYRYGGRAIRVEAARHGRRVVLCVADDGPGVAPEFVPELFEPFTRAGAVTGTPGSGLGLAISRRLANALGGDLSYDAAGPGARFVVSLRGAA